MRRIRSNYSTCIRERAKPSAQLMKGLPFFRLDSFTCPFSHMAVDFFGPIQSSSYRNRVTKKYEELFTCLVTREVHLELALSVSSTDFLLVFRHFFGIYNKPKTVHSDNGTSFMEEERELYKLIESFTLVKS